MNQRTFLFILSFIIIAPSILLQINKETTSHPLYAEYFLGDVPLNITGNLSIGEKPSISNLLIPPSWDWRNYLGQDWTTPAKYQGPCGSCWAFAAMGALESVIKIREGCSLFNPDLSEQYLLSCPPNSGGCSGWNAYYAYDYLYKHGGALLEDCFPYRANDEIPCSQKCENWLEKLVPISGYGRFYQPARDFMKKFLVENGPFVVRMAVYSDFYRYDGGIYEHPGIEPPSDINHEVIIVGYNDSQQYWICKNSWGKQWGENGFFRIKYGDCQIEHDLIYVNYNADSFNWPPIANAGDSYKGRPNEEIIFDGSESVDPDNDIVLYEWNFGDGSFANGKTVKHAYTKERVYTVSLKVTDSENHSSTNTALVYIDGTSPNIRILQPKEGCLYVFGKEYARFFGFVFRKPVIIGPITIYADAKDNMKIEKVEFYIDENLVYECKNPPYSFHWKTATNGQHSIKVIAYDYVGNKNEENMNVIRFG